MEDLSEKKGFSKFSIILILLGIIVFFLFADWVLMRTISARQVDDFNPQISCKGDIINKSEILMIIPIYNNVSIAENKSWCKETLKLNKTLGMHGVYHTYQEFLEPRDEEYIKRGMEEFKKCFGFYPGLFEAPQLALNKDNLGVIESLGMKVNTIKFNIFHKVYHCSDTGAIRNSIIDKI